MTMPDWYFAVWVKGPLPTMSPTAYRPSTRLAVAQHPQAAVGVERVDLAVEPDRLQPQVGQVRAPPGGDEQLLGLDGLLRRGRR